MMSHHKKISVGASLIALLLTACDGQQATDGSTTAPVARVKISSIKFSDPQLADCVLQARVAQNAIYVEELKKLECSWLARLDGIEQLTHLTQLIMANEPVETLDLSKLTQLEELHVSANVLDLSHNPKLRVINASVHSIRLPQSGKLETLYLYTSSELKNWDFSQTTDQSPTRYSIGLDLSKENNLTDLNVTGNFPAIKLPEASNLRYLNVTGAAVGHVDNLEQQTHLETLTIPLGDKATYLNLSNLNNLTIINITANGLKQLVLSKAQNIADFTLLSESVEALSFEDLTSVQNIVLSVPKVTKIKLGAHDFLANFSLSAPKLKELNLGESPNLHQLSLGANQLSELNLNNYPALTYINIGKSNLKKLNIDKLDQLQDFYLGRSQLESLAFYPGWSPASAQVVQAFTDRPIRIIDNPFLKPFPSIYKISDLTPKEIPDTRLLECVKASAKNELAIYADELKSLICRGEDGKGYVEAAERLKTGVENTYSKRYVFNTQGLEIFENLEQIDFSVNFIAQFELSPNVWLQSLILDGNFIQRAEYLNARHLSLNNTPLQRVHLSSLTQSFEAKSGISLSYLPAALIDGVKIFEDDSVNITFSNYTSPIELTSDGGNIFVTRFKSDRLPAPNWQPLF
ncbi:MAG: hypothetical protein RL497_710 [Pseudomonadota bacterium]|jgi:hypothetical protein